MKQFFFCEGENKSKKTHSSFFLSFLFFFTRELFEFFFSNIKRTPLKCSKFLTRYISFIVTGNKRSSALKTRESIVLLVRVKKVMVLER